MTPQLSRRTLLGSLAVAIGAIRSGGSMLAQEVSEPTDPACRRCRGLKLVPRTNLKSYVYVEGQGEFQPAEAAIGQPCPLCQAEAVKTASIEQANQQHAEVLGQHALWEERLDEKLLLVQTRHAAIHTQLKPADAKRVGEAVEEMAIRLQKAAGSLAITPTRPDHYPQMILWGEPSWTKFRTVMETLFSPDQLGDSWQNAGKGTMYDHVAVAHFYVTAKIVREVPAECSAVKLAATRQIYLATGMQAPAWLIEGFAAYAQLAVFGAARVFTIYAQGRGPTRPVTLADTARQAAATERRPWDKLLTRDLRDFEPADYSQSLAMVAYLLDNQPAKFLTFVERLKSGEACPAALEQAYGQSVAELDSAGAKWLASR